MRVAHVGEVLAPEGDTCDGGGYAYRDEQDGCPNRSHAWGADGGDDQGRQADVDQGKGYGGCQDRGRARAAHVWGVHAGGDATLRPRCPCRDPSRTWLSSFRAAVPSFWSLSRAAFWPRSSASRCTPGRASSALSWQASRSGTISAAASPTAGRSGARSA